MIARRLLPLLPLLPLLLAGCHHAAPPGTYAIATADALERLAHADTDGLIKAQRCGIPITIAGTVTGTGGEAQAMHWAVLSEGEQVAGFAVTLTTAGDQATNATIAIPADPAGGEIYDGDKHYDHPALQQPLRPAVQELVDAAMAQRPFDAARIAGDHAVDGLCSIQRSGVDSGNAHFSIHDHADAGAHIDTSPQASDASSAATAYIAPMLTPAQEANDPGAGHEGQH